VPIRLLLWLFNINFSLLNIIGHYCFAITRFALFCHSLMCNKHDDDDNELCMVCRVTDCMPWVCVYAPTCSCFIDDCTEIQSSSPVPLLPSCRLTLVVIGFFMFIHLYAQRVGMSVAIVCMVNQTALRQKPTFSTEQGSTYSNANFTENDSNWTSSHADVPGCLRQEDDIDGGQTVCPWSIIRLDWT